MDYEKIDKLIAVHVMGWEIRNVDFTQDGSYFEAFFDEKGNRLGIVGAYEFNPSEYIQDAWIVVEALRKKHLKVYIETEFRYYDVYVKNGLGNYMTERHQEESLPKAICLAALEALEVEVN